MNFGFYSHLYLPYTSICVSNVWWRSVPIALYCVYIYIIIIFLDYSIHQILSQGKNKEERERYGERYKTSVCSST